MISPVRKGGLELSLSLSLCITRSPFSSPHLSSGQIFIRPAQCLTWQGSMDITCRVCGEATGLAWWGQILSHGPSSTLTAPIKCKTGIVADENVYLTAHIYPLSLSLSPVSFFFRMFWSQLWSVWLGSHGRYQRKVYFTFDFCDNREKDTSTTVCGSCGKAEQNRDKRKVDWRSEREKQKGRP